MEKNIHKYGIIYFKTLTQHRLKNFCRKEKFLRFFGLLITNGILFFRNKKFGFKQPEKLPSKWATGHFDVENLFLNEQKCLLLNDVAAYYKDYFLPMIDVIFVLII